MILLVTFMWELFLFSPLLILSNPPPPPPRGLNKGNTVHVCEENLSVY